MRSSDERKELSFFGEDCCSLEEKVCVVQTMSFSFQEKVFSSCEKHLSCQERLFFLKKSSSFQEKQRRSSNEEWFFREKKAAQQGIHAV